VQGVVKREELECAGGGGDGCVGGGAVAACEERGGRVRAGGMDGVRGWWCACVVRTARKSAVVLTGWEEV